MTKSKVFLILSLSFVVGVGLGSYIDEWRIIIMIIMIITAIMVMILDWRHPRSRLIGFILIFLALGLARYELSWPRVNQDKIQFYNETKELTFRGVVIEEPDTRLNHVKLTVRAESLFLKGSELEIKGKVLVKASLYPTYEYGDELEITCALREPEILSFEDDRGYEREFAYNEYLARFNIYSLCYEPSVRLIRQNQGNIIIKTLFGIKHLFVNTTNKILPEPQASFLGGLLLGAKRGIPEDLLKSFNLTGTTHIVAISGYNITIIAITLSNLAKTFYISRRKSFWLILLGILFFVVITGAQASIVRAAIMGIIVLVASRAGRPNHITNVLVLAAGVMLLINPKILVFDVGFQLSFLATIGLVYLSPILEKYFKWVPQIFGLRESLNCTLSAIILTTPIVLYNFGRLSLIAPLANILILPLVPITMAVGFVAGVVGLINLGLGQMVAWSAWFLLSAIIGVAEILARFPYAAIDFGKFHWIIVVVSYGILGKIMWGRKR